MGSREAAPTVDNRTYPRTAQRCRCNAYRDPMAATLTSILLHITFSTKHREPVLPQDVLPDLFQYMGGVCRDMQSPLLHAGGVADHVHLLVSLGKTVAVSDLLMNTKRATSIWLKGRHADLARFAWQDGYFCFSVGHDSINAVKAYLDSQEAHHRVCDFKQEVLAFLNKYGIEFDERYLWD